MGKCSANNRQGSSISNNLNVSHFALLVFETNLWCKSSKGANCSMRIDLECQWGLTITTVNQGGCVAVFHALITLPGHIFAKTQVVTFEFKKHTSQMCKLYFHQIAKVYCCQNKSVIMHTYYQHSVIQLQSQNICRHHSNFKRSLKIHVILVGCWLQ